MKRKYDPRKVKRHRSYTVKALAGLYGVGTNTVRQWIRLHSLPTIEGSYPVLMHWKSIREWMTAWQTARKWTCGPDEMSCLKCQGPCKVKAGTFRIATCNKATLMMSGECQTCGKLMNRATSQAKLQTEKANFASKSMTYNAPLNAHSSNPKAPLNPSL